MTCNPLKAFFRAGFRKLLLAFAAVCCFSLSNYAQDCKITIESARIMGSCGSAHTGFIKAKVNNVTGSYSMKWKGSGAMNNKSLSQDNLHPGTYSLTVMDQLGCSATRKFQVQQLKAPVVIAKSEGSEDDDEEGRETDDDDDDREQGAISLKVNGTRLKTVFWLGPEGVLSTTKTKLKNLSGGAYTYVVYAENGCTTVGTVELN